MSLLSGMFGSKSHPNVDQVAKIMHDRFNVVLQPPPKDVVDILSHWQAHDLAVLESVLSVEGAQEILKRHSILAMVDLPGHKVTFSVAPIEQIEQQLKAEVTDVPVIHVANRHATQHIIKPIEPSAPLKKEEPAHQLAAQAPQGVLEHLPAAERLCTELMDLFLKHGQINSGDKEVLKKIIPTDDSPLAHVVALEHWQAEFTRRARGIHIPKTSPHLLLTEDETTKKDPTEDLTHRFDDFVRWLGKIVKALESRGVKYHNKPVWLPRT